VLWINEHYEGGYLFRDRLVVEIVPPPRTEGDSWRVKFAWQGSGVTPPNDQFEVQALSGQAVDVRIPFGNQANPGIRGVVRLTASGWNVEE
jgi:hypothetical protein